MYEDERQIRKRKLHRALSVLAVLVFLFGGGYAVYALTIGRPVFDGKRTLDFGVVQFEDSGGKAVTGEFVLTNGRSESIHVVGVKTSCGCTTVAKGPWTIEPGEEWHLPVELALSRAGLKESELEIVTEKHGNQILHVRGVGREHRRLSSRVEMGMELLPGIRTPVSVIAKVYDYGNPPGELDVEAPEHVTIEFGEWRRPSSHRPPPLSPELWETHVYVTQTEGERMEGERLTIWLVDRPEEKLVIPINVEQHAVEIDDLSPVVK